MFDPEDFRLDKSYDAEIRAVTGWLNQVGVNFVRCSPFHLKIGKVNYYISRGRIVIDGEGKRHDGCGLPALQALLRERGYLSSSAAANVTSFRSRR